MPLAIPEERDLDTWQLACSHWWYHVPRPGIVRYSLISWLQSLLISKHLETWIISWSYYVQYHIDVEDIKTLILWVCHPKSCAKILKMNPFAVQSQPDPSPREAHGHQSSLRPRPIPLHCPRRRLPPRDWLWSISDTDQNLGNVASAALLAHKRFYHCYSNHLWRFITRLNLQTTRRPSCRKRQSSKPHIAILATNNGKTKSQKMKPCPRVVHEMSLVTLAKSVQIPPQPVPYQPQTLLKSHSP